MVLLKLKELKVKLQWTKRNINKKISERDEEAAKAANSHDFIVSLPQGLRHTCWRARRFVKWRTERIAIARALLKNAPILILDKDWTPSNSSGPFVRDCILLAACEAHESLPQSVEFPADVFTSCLTTPIKMALRCLAELEKVYEIAVNGSDDEKISAAAILCGAFLTRGWNIQEHTVLFITRLLSPPVPADSSGESYLIGCAPYLNVILLGVTTVDCVQIFSLHGLRLFRQDLLVASLFQNFLLAERIMSSANCSPVSYPMLPPTHQHHMWDAWDMAAKICLAQLPVLVEDPNAEF